MQSFVEHALTATNTQLNSRLEGGKVTRVPHTLKEAMDLRQAAGWKAATVKEMDGLKELNVYTFVPK